MAIANNMCVNCEKLFVCKIADKLAVFAEDAKKPLGVNITVDECREYAEVKGLISINEE